MTSSTTVDKKDIQKLQRAIVDGLEDVKAQDIQVFDTTHLSPLFERVILASGTSNRQTKALAASVRDAVREAGFDKPRTEGESNGEWIIVDCGQAVVHVMQPNFRQYYKLEELWGEKPVRLKLGAAKPAVPATPAKAAAKKTAVSPTLKRSSAAKLGALELNPPKPKAKPKAPAKKSAIRVTKANADATATVPAKKVTVKKVVVKTAAVKKAAAKKTAVKKVAAQA